MEYVSDNSNGLLVIADISPDRSINNLRVIQQDNVLYEDFFQFDRPPAQVKIVDKRNTMHRRGWTYFKIIGEINGREFSAVGQMPFVYDVYLEYRPWAKIKLDGKIIYEGYNLPDGLARPWMGLHTIYDVRRTSKLLMTDYFGYDNYRSPSKYGRCEKFKRTMIVPETWRLSSYWCYDGSSDVVDDIKLRAVYTDGYVQTYSTAEVMPMKISKNSAGTVPYPDGVGAGIFYLPPESFP